MQLGGCEPGRHERRERLSRVAGGVNVCVTASLQLGGGVSSHYFLCNFFPSLLTLVYEYALVARATPDRSAIVPF